MNIVTYSSYNNVISNNIKGKVAVCIDVFCSCTTLIGAFNNGIKRVLIVDDPIEAPTYKHQLNDDRILMGGAYEFERIAGLDVSDNINDYTEEVVQGKELIYSNANLAPAINIAKESDTIILSAFVNCRAVASKLASLNKDIALICCGTNGIFNLEDGLAAGAIIEQLDPITNIELSEHSQVIYSFYKQHKNNLFDVIKDSDSYKKLDSLELYEDLSLGLNLNKYDIVPTLYDNWITAL